MLKLKILGQPLRKILNTSLKPPLFSEEVNNFCIKHDIVNECIRFYELIKETFKDIKSISVSVIEDYEIENYQHISFIIDIDDEIDNVLRLEDELMEKKFRKLRLIKCNILHLT